MSEPIHGRILHVKMQKTEESGQKMKNLLEEQSSTLYINETFVDGAGSSARTTRHYAKRKSWKISSTMLFSIEDFGRIFLAMRDEDILGVSFGHEYNGIVYEGNAFPTKITVTGNVHSLVKCQVEWQGTGVLDKRYVGDAGIYGVVIDTESSSYKLERVGSDILHQTLPIQSMMRRCLLLDDGTVNYYLDANNSSLKSDGTPAILDGTDGMVMVEIPHHYRRLQWIDSTRYRVDISESPLAGGVEVPKMYVSAFEASCDRRERGNMGGYYYYKLASVVNATSNFRGGTNQSSWDDTYRSLLGMPATNYNVRRFRLAARMRGNGWNCYEYRCHLAIYWLYVIEYACLDAEQDFNTNLTAEGYHQGGLGKRGILMSSTVWSAYNSSNPIIPCGYTLELGNYTGTKEFYLSAEQLQKYKDAGGTLDTPSYLVASYRGIENPSGHIAKFLDGIDFTINSTSWMYRWDNATEYDNYDSNSRKEFRLKFPGSEDVSGYTKSIVGGENADMACSEVGTTYNHFLGRFYALKYSSKRTPAVGGCLSYGNSYRQLNSMRCTYSWYSAGEQTAADHGTRLCYCSEPNCFIEV